MASNTIKTRVQLKCDTEANWNKSVLVADGGEKESGTSFVPLRGEVIIYSAETSSDELPTGRNIPLPFSRFKVGDGVTNVVRLPFIGAGSAEKVNHTLTFGNGGVYVYDGSADVTVPVYTGTIL